MVALRSWGLPVKGKWRCNERPQPGLDLVLMDVHMAPMDGLEATRRIKRRKGAPVVILCALDDSGHVRAAAQAAGADAFVPKAPKMFATLAAAIRSAFPGVNLR